MHTSDIYEINKPKTKILTRISIKYNEFSFILYETIEASHTAVNVDFTINS